MKNMDFEFLINSTENIAIAIVILLVVSIEIWLVNKGFNYLKKKVENHNFKSYKIQSWELLDKDKKQLFYRGLINLIQILTILNIIYFSLILTLSLSPVTEVVANKLIDFIFLPLKTSFLQLVDYLPDLFTVVVIVVIFRYLISLVKSVAKEVVNRKLKIPGFEAHWARTTGRIMVFSLNILMIILIMPYLPGYESLAFKGIAAFLGALITIGGSSIIANFMAGIVITYMNSFRIGDWVEIDSTLGEIIEISAFAVKVKTHKKIIVTIPNSKILTTHINNYSGGKGNHQLLLHTKVSIGYEVLWKEVNELLLSAAHKTEGIDKTSQPFVRQDSLDDFYVIYELNVYSENPSEMPHVYSELHKNILEEFNTAGIDIVTPYYQVDRQEK